MAKKPKKTEPAKQACVCGGDCLEKGAYLPGYLLIALGSLALPINFDLLPGLQWAKAWPLLLVLFGIVIIVKTAICRRKSYEIQ
ncbi:MAG: DUF5668 domain-containing protein [Candidatus Bilamarchaeaceae archaeon]